MELWKRVKQAFRRKPGLMARIYRLNDYYMDQVQGKPLYLVYSSGKSGTTTIFNTLKAYGFKRVYQFHSLDKENLIHLKNRFSRRNLPVPSAITNGLFLNSSLARIKKRPVKIVTLVREPISQSIASYFQNQDRFGNEVTTDSMGEAIRSSLINLDDWFTNELLEFFQINVFNSDFTPQKGYSIIRSGQTDCLLIRTDVLNDTGAKALEEFLGIQNVQLENTNQASDKAYFDMYQQVKQDFKLNADEIDSLLRSRTMNKFFDSQELDRLRVLFLNTN